MPSTASTVRYSTVRYSIVCLCAIVILPLGLIAQPTQASDFLSLGDHYTAEVQGSSYPDFFRTLNGATLFSALHPTLGHELWITDGTPEGTRLLKDIHAGSASSFPAELTRLGDWIYFTATDHSFGRELWRTDGTAAGTELVMDIDPGSIGSSPRDLTVLGDALIFVAFTLETGFELWRLPADGPPRLIVDLESGTDSSQPDDLLAIGSTHVAFSARAGSAGAELGITDGTEAGTVIYDIDPAGGSHAEPLAADSAARLYFRATTPDHGSELWILDVRAGNWRRISDAMPGTGSSSPRDPIVSGTTLFVNLSTPDGRKLFRSRSGGAVEEVAALDAKLPVLLGPDVLFVVDRSLWITDELGKSVQQLASPNIRLLDVESQLTYLVPFQDEVYFFGDGGLWSSDGTDVGTDVRAGASWIGLGTLQAAQNRIYASLDQGGFGEEPWVYDGSDFERLADLHRFPADSDPQEFTAVGDTLYFTATVDGVGRELLFWNGEAAAAQLVEDLIPGLGGSGPERLMAAGDRLFYQAQAPSAGNELLVIEDPSDGAVVLDVEPGPFGSAARPLAPLGSEAFFIVQDSLGRFQLWITDSGDFSRITSFTGSDALGVSSLGQPAMIDGWLYLVANDGSLGGELWRSDGSDLILVADLMPGPDGSGLSNLLAQGHWLFFSGTSDVEGRQLWRIDSQFQTLLPITEWGDPLVGLGSSTLLTKRDADIGYELWSTDGTSEGTQLLRDLWPGLRNGLGNRSLPFGASDGERAFFDASDPTAGNELWTSDGTRSGTRRVRDVVVGPVSSSPRELTILPNGDVVFTAYTPETGWELWRSDGSGPGTYLVGEVIEGPGSSQPTSLTVFGDWVVFSARSEATGKEPWAYDWTVSSYLFGDDFESGSLSAWTSN